MAKIIFLTLILKLYLFGQFISPSSYTVQANTFINTAEQAHDIIPDICFESFIYIGVSNGKYKLSTIEETASTPDVWTAPLKQNDRELISQSTTHIDFIANDYVINYVFCHLNNAYINFNLIQ